MLIAITIISLLIYPIAGFLTFLASILGKIKFLIISSILVYLSIASFATSIIVYDLLEPSNLEIVESQPFIKLQNKVTELDNLENIAILQKEDFIVINKNVIDLKNKTYGPEPDFATYGIYYENSSKNQFSNFEDLLKEINLECNEEDIFGIIDLMKELKFIDIYKDKSKNSNNPIVIFSNDTSAMWGSSGIIFSFEEMPEIDETNLSQYKIKDNYYYFFRN